MILGEEIWIDQLSTEEEYDEFFKKIRKAIKKTAKKIQPLKILRPVIKRSTVGGLGTKIKPKKPVPTPRPKGSKQTQVIAQNRKDIHHIKTVEEARKELLKEIEEHNEQKSQDARALEIKEASLIQAQIDADYGNNKQLVSTGMIAIVGFIGLVAVIVYVKSRNHKNQLEAMKLQVAAQGAITK